MKITPNIKHTISREKINDLEPIKSWDYKEIKQMPRWSYVSESKTQKAKTQLFLTRKRNLKFSDEKIEKKKRYFKDREVRKNGQYVEEKEQIFKRNANGVLKVIIISG